jgi:hypothetical protein
VNLENPSGDIKPQDWIAWYSEIQSKLYKVKDENLKIKDDIDRRQARYIVREKDYRKNLDGLHRELRVR